MTPEPSDTPEAVESLADLFAAEMARHNRHVNCCSCGWVADMLGRTYTTADLEAEWTAHVGAALAASEPLARDRAQQRAEAWHEGAAAGHHSPLTWYALRKCNPYLTTPTDDPAVIADRAARTATPEGGQHG